MNIPSSVLLVFYRDTASSPGGRIPSLELCTLCSVCCTLIFFNLFPLTLSAQPAYPAAKTGGNYMHNFYFPPAPSSTPWYPSWSPDGEAVAVAMQGSIWSIEVASGLATELVSGPKYYSSPNYSPDGRWLVYTADDHGRSIQLEVLNIETGETTALTNNTQIYTDPSFSPDGTRIAYVSTEPSG